MPWSGSGGPALRTGGIAQHQDRIDDILSRAAGAERELTSAEKATIRSLERKKRELGGQASELGQKVERFRAAFDQLDKDKDPADVVRTNQRLAGLRK